MWYARDVLFIEQPHRCCLGLSEALPGLQQWMECLPFPWVQLDATECSRCDQRKPEMASICPRLFRVLGQQLPAFWQSYHFHCFPLVIKVVDVHGRKRGTYRRGWRNKNGPNSKTHMALPLPCHSRLDYKVKVPGLALAGVINHCWLSTVPFSKSSWVRFPVRATEKPAGLFSSCNCALALAFEPRVNTFR